MRIRLLVACSQISRRPSRSQLSPLPLLDGCATTSTPADSDQRLRVSPGMSENRSEPPSRFVHSGPSVKVKPEPMHSSSASASTRSSNPGALTSTTLICVLPPGYWLQGLAGDAPPARLDAFEDDGRVLLDALAEVVDEHLREVLDELGLGLFIEPCFVDLQMDDGHAPSVLWRFVGAESTARRRPARGSPRGSAR